MATWPSPVEVDGTAPVLMSLLGSDDLFLVRQAAYLVFVGRALKESGYQIETFQQSLQGLTVPLVMKNNKGLPAAVYTNSEPWSPASVADLRSWIAALRKAGVGVEVPVIVVAQDDSPDVAKLAEVFQFIHTPSDKLPGQPQGVV